MCSTLSVLIKYENVKLVYQVSQEPFSEGKQKHTELGGQMILRNRSTKRTRSWKFRAVTFTMHRRKTLRVTKGNYVLKPHTFYFGFLFLPHLLNPNCWQLSVYSWLWQQFSSSSNLSHCLESHCVLIRKEEVRCHMRVVSCIWLPLVSLATMQNSFIRCSEAKWKPDLCVFVGWFVLLCSLYSGKHTRLCVHCCQVGTVFVVALKSHTRVSCKKAFKGQYLTSEVIFPWRQ